ncbi:MAG: Eco57I restriction-modification methylase domain-containing protein [Candidatus Peribacteraceae bacterium]|nr:Eco57I restriction-modification methylase domain-containing protein [Candidatus Peribacteraceae bacterium]
MDKNTATKLIRDTFQNSFDKERYVNFVKNLLNTIDESKAFSLYGQYVPEKFREFVKGYERIGTFTDPEGLKLDVLIVHLKSETTLARARTSQRNFIANYLKSRDAKDAGLIAFVSPNPEDWRFSFVKMDYKLVEKKGKIKAEEDFTPARRYSFLVGSHESSHTAQRQLLPILADDKHNPTLKLIENAFNIETVTKEFFEKYRDLFLHVKEELDALVETDNGLKAEFEKKGVNTADFTKKLLGQIVFLYFLQKKGWFGVGRDAAWGSGHKNFLRQLFEGNLMRYKNFFNDVLEPLFYEALAVEREENYYSKFNCKIPFLNGGLFDPISSYDWVHTDITLGNDLFSNTVKTKEGDVGNGILDIFDRYNFTVKEDEPLEKEVAVDPEMLGKVFENLLEVNDRKSKGTYYTPREIVHYMCEESLINYLANELHEKVSKEDITIFVHMGNMVIEHESRVVREGKETDAYSYILPESIRDNAALIDKKLAEIRVCDPAIGSGAFPVGMMSEIVSARQTLSNYLPNKKNRTPYDLKRHAIQESLYGVDIEPGAVEIAKLRLWLSLIVDEDDIERIKPLPNLDYRIMQGNSLLEEFEGIRLFDEKLLESSSEDKEKELANAKAKINVLQQEYFALHSGDKLTDMRKEEIQSEIKHLQDVQKQLHTKPKQSENMGIFDAPSRVGEVLKELKALHKDFFEATQKKKKDEAKKKIESLEWELIEISLTEKNKGDLLAKLKQTRVRPFFLWKLQFAEVFREKKGFDVVIANPPYVRMEEIKELKPQLENNYQVYSGRADLYCYFYELGFRLLHKHGVLSFITSNKYLRSNYGRLLRQLIKKDTAIASLIDFGDLPVFEATAYPCILITKKTDGGKSEFLGCKIETEEELAAFQKVLTAKAIMIGSSGNRVGSNLNFSAT